MRVLQKKGMIQDQASFILSFEMILSGLCGLALGLIPDHGLTFSIAFSLSSFLSLYGMKEGVGLIFFFLCGCFMQSFWQFYFALILVCLFALLNALVKLLKGNVVLFVPINAGLVGALASIVLEKAVYLAIMQMVLVLFWANLWTESMQKKQRRLQEDSFFLFFTFSLSVTAFSLYFKTAGMLLLVFVNLIFSLRVSTRILFCGLMIQSFLTPQIMLKELVFCFLLLNGFRKGTWIEQLLAFIAPLLLLNYPWKVVLAYVLLFMSAYLIQKTQFKQEKEEALRDNPQLSYLEHQLFQFSRIFELINLYFEEHQGMESGLLKGMSEAISNLSLQLKQSACFMQEESVRIKKLLEGYHYHVIKVEVTLTRLLQKKVVLHLEHCNRQDAKEVILPLLNMVVSKGLKLTGMAQRRGLSTVTVLEFCTEVPLQVHTQIYQHKKEEALSGDTCCRFDCHDLCICTLSDGMGTGSEANKISVFVTELTQRLLSAGMPIETAVKTMNQFLNLKKQETFATLDVLILDRLQKQAYLCKSGTCCTLLLRNHQVLKLHSNSLPLGIVEKIEADFYRLDLHDEDLFVLFSDGIQEDVAEKILLTTKRNQINHEFEELMNKNSFDDDATVLLAKICKR